MHPIQVSIQIDRPVKEVFAFALNPQNTPKWVGSIVLEETNEWPVRVGTVYRSQRKNGEWGELTVTAFVEDKLFVLAQKDSDFYVRYGFEYLDAYKTRLVYELPGSSGFDEAFIVELLKSFERAIGGAQGLQ